MELLSRDKDTICAPATGPAQGAISVIRISGSNAASITRRLAQFLPEQLESHKIYYGYLRGENDRVLDEVLVSYFAEGRSFTGESTCEISCHGNQFVVDEILLELVRAGARPAERGEFTYRAFIHGRLDLVQAESVLDVIQSRSHRAAQIALRQLQGNLSQELIQIREDLTWVLANLEANIDFAAEDIVVATDDRLVARAEKIKFSIEHAIAAFEKGRSLKDGLLIVLAGRPNVGKSSLLNRLLGENRAIVSPIAGTTRDTVDGVVQWNGNAVRVVDTAGLRISDDEIEKLGIDRTHEKLAEADLIIYVEENFEFLQDGRIEGDLKSEKVVFVLSKSDLLPLEQKRPRYFHHQGTPFPLYEVSSTTGEGLSTLVSELQSRLVASIDHEAQWICNSRQFGLLVKVRDSLADGLTALHNGESPDLVALEFSEALQSIYEVLGLVFDDQVMDRVFSEFCLGK